MYPFQSFGYQVQQQSVEQIQTRLPALSETLNYVSEAEAECNAANIEENDYTIFTCQDLEFELELLVQRISKKIAFIDNQVSGNSAYQGQPSSRQT